jgi:hapalindole biogenesis HpiC1 cyclase-like protein
MLRNRFLNLLILPLAAVVAAVPAWADVSLNQYITNPAFSILSSPLTNCGTATGPATPLYCNSAVADWDISNGAGAMGGAGTVQLSGQGSGQGSAYSQTDLLPLTGNNAAYINNLVQFQYLSPTPYATQWEAISQTLNNVTLQPDTTYSFSYAVARRLDDIGGNFRVQVNAVANNSAILGTDYWILAGDTTTFTAGQWNVETLTFTTPSNAALFGTTPTLYLVNDGLDAPYNQALGSSGVAQIEFAATPEPAEFLPLALMVFLLGFCHRLRLRA